MSALYLHSVGHFHPENVIDNKLLEQLDIGTSDEWIVERVGIRTRRTVLPIDYIRTTRNADVRAGQEAALYTNVETGRRAGLEALKRANLQPSDIGMVIAGGCSPEMQIPSEACRIAHALGIEAPALDINSACSSFGAQLHMLSMMNPLPKFVMVVNPENTTRVVDYADRSAAVLWGDATSAAIVSNTETSRLKIVNTMLGSSPAGWGQVTVPNFGHFAQNGSAVQRFAIKTSLHCLEQLLPAARARVAQTGGSVKFIGHQANGLMLDSVIRRAAIDPIDHFHNVLDFGNTGAAGAPSVLSGAWDKLKDGDSVVLVVVGSGLTWAGLQIDVGAA